VAFLSPRFLVAPTTNTFEALIVTSSFDRLQEELSNLTDISVAPAADATNI
jgi:hypothetical protein